MSETFGTVLTFVPLFIIVWIANIAEARREKGEPYDSMALIAYVFVIVMYGAMFLIGLLLQLVAVAAKVNPEILAGPLSKFPADSLNLLAIGLWLPALFGVVLLLPAARRLVARYTKIDPAS